MTAGLMIICCHVSIHLSCPKRSPARIAYAGAVYDLPYFNHTSNVLKLSYLTRGDFALSGGG